MICARSRITPFKSACGKFSEGLGIVSGTSRAIHQLLQDDAARFAVPQSPRGLQVARLSRDGAAGFSPELVASFHVKRRPHAAGFIGISELSEFSLSKIF